MLLFCPTVLSRFEECHQGVIQPRSSIRAELFLVFQGYECLSCAQSLPGSSPLTAQPWHKCCTSFPRSRSGCWSCQLSTLPSMGSPEERSGRCLPMAATALYQELNSSEGHTKEPAIGDKHTYNCSSHISNTAEYICFQTLCWFGLIKSPFSKKYVFLKRGRWDIFLFIFLLWTHLNCHNDVTMETALKVAR